MVSVIHDSSKDDPTTRDFDGFIEATYRMLHSSVR